MRKLFILLIISAVGLGATAQAPQGLSHQAVIRNADNRLVTNAPVGIRVSIIRGAEDGVLVYAETHTITSNSNGLVSFVIGQGTVISGEFANIEWTNGPYFVKTEMDPTGNTDYSITGISQLLSVPYALHSNTAQTLTGSITESDPVFSISPASGISNANISNWNTAFSWGNHASAGYVLGSRNITINGITQNLSANRTWNVGTVTSVGLALPSIFTVSESPVTGSGTLTASLVTQPANRVFASPGGSSGAPEFRALLAEDIPDLNWSKITSGKPTTIGGYGITDAVTTSGSQTIAGTKTFSNVIVANNGLSAGNSRITNLANPVNNQDAATKAYVDSSISEITEDDPLFSLSPASGISDIDISNWNTSFSWGNHASAGYVLSSRNITINGVTQNLSANRIWNVGTVTSVGLALPSIFTVSESPVTGSGTLTATLVTQPANMIFASPGDDSGTPGFRTLLASDVPDLDWSKITSGLPTTIDGYGIIDAVMISGDQTIAGIKTFSDPILANNGLDAGSSRITNLANPVNDQDAVTKAYFENNKIQNGTTAGEMLYWNGSDWIVIPPGNYGQTLAYCDGVPSWGGCPPIITTAEITNNTGTSATSGGSVLNDGGSPVIQRGVCWDISPNPTLDFNLGYTSDGGGIGTFTSEITGLTEQTTYYVRAYAINNIGISYGDEVQFTSPLWTCGISSITDVNGNTYNTVVIGTQCWMASNLNVGTQVFVAPSNNGLVEKYCYNHDPVNCQIYGGLYTWHEMMNYQSTPGIQGICPEGWSIPKVSDFETLITYLGGNFEAGGKMKETGNNYWEDNTGATNESGFSSRGAGYHTGGFFSQLKYYANFWSSNTSSGQSQVLTNINSSGNGWMSQYQTSYFNSVRCIKY